MSDLPETKENCTKKTCCPTTELFQGAIWWSMLLVGVIAIPAIALIVTFALPLSEAGQVFSFIVTCWVSTWVGMWLMKKAK